MNTYTPIKSYQDMPESLLMMSIDKIIQKPLDLKRFKLPPELGQLLASTFRDYALANRLPQRKVIEFFGHFDRNYIPLTTIDFSCLPISWYFLKKFMKEYSELVEINISQCPTLRGFDAHEFSDLLQLNPDNKKRLIIGDTFSKMIDINSPSGRVLHEKIKLTKLVLHKVCADPNADEFAILSGLSKVLTPKMSTSLRYLDLSMCTIGKGSALLQLQDLEILILYDCDMNYLEAIPVICNNCKKIRVLDISRLAIDADDFISNDEEEPKLLDIIVERLPELDHLDISGTCLISGKDRNISAFEARAEKPFKFLGLFHTSNDAAHRSCIPAQIIAGEANETQILNACEAYIDRPGQLSKALNDLYNLYKYITPSETFDNVNRALDVVLAILMKHMRDEQVIIFTTAALCCIVKINLTTRNLTDAKVKRTITSRLLDVMHYHETSKVILVNGGITLLFLPDIICEYSRIASISLKMCRDDDARTQGFGTTLLNTLACQVEGDQKIFIGTLNAIETMIDIITSKIKENTCDEILETAWSTLWNITDETPINCQKFLEFNGLEAFESCMDKFGDNKEVLRNIMGLLGNVAECQRLRVNFMKENYIQRFYSLLSSPIDGIECSYNACGILAHLMSDGAHFWERHLPRHTRLTILAGMKSAITKWPIHSRRNINYRSFEPIVRLLETYVPPEAQYWAVFALANLTRINPSKYCPMLIPHEGLVKLRKLAELPSLTGPYVSNLAKVTIYQYERFQTEGTLSGLEQCDSVDLEVIRNFRAEPSAGDGTSETGDQVF